MADLARHLRAVIAREGPITVERFMAEALGHPEHGYYRRGDPLGAAGDFVTAPEVSQVFGELIGAWCAVVWEKIGRPAPVRLVELGPGRGTLMADALRGLAAAAPDFGAAARLHLVETSPALREKQAAALAAHAPAWHAELAEVPAGPLLLVANELFDALPVRQLVRTAAGWRERLVAAAGEELRFVLGDAPAAPPAPAPEAAEGAVFEFSPAGRTLAGAIGARLARDGGAALVVDYGHAATAAGETLQAVRRHRFHPVLAAPGEADLTAHVDFAALAAAARAAGARAHGPVAQGTFLARLGLEARAAALMRHAPPRQAEEIRRACRRLIDAREMGTLFKALALTGPRQPTPPGFEDDAP